MKALKNHKNLVHGSRARHPIAEGRAGIELEEEEEEGRARSRTWPTNIPPGYHMDALGRARGRRDIPGSSSGWGYGYQLPWGRHTREASSSSRRRTTMSGDSGRGACLRVSRAWRWRSVDLRLVFS